MTDGERQSIWRWIREQTLGALGDSWKGLVKVVIGAIVLAVLALRPGAFGVLSVQLPLWAVVVAVFVTIVVAWVVSTIKCGRCAPSSDVGGSGAYSMSLASGETWRTHEGLDWKGTLYLHYGGETSLERIEGPYCPKCRTKMVSKRKGILEILQPTFKWVCSESSCRETFFAAANQAALREEVRNVVEAEIEKGNLGRGSNKIKWSYSRGDGLF